MKNSLSNRILRPAAAALLLAAFATSPAAAAEPAPTGWIVVSLSQERGISTVAIAFAPKVAKTPVVPKAPADPNAPKGLSGLGILTKNKNPGPPKESEPSQSTKLPKLEAAFSIAPPPDDLQKWEGRSGVVRVLKVPAGAYSLVNFRLEHAESNRKTFARDNYDIRFLVMENEVTYLGEFQGTQFLNKRPTAAATVPQPYFIVQDQQGRDMPLAEAANPEIRGKPVTSIAPVKAKGKSHFQTSRIPDKE